MAQPVDSLGATRPLLVDGTSYATMSLAAAEANGLAGLTRLPRSLKVLAENVLRHEDGRAVTAATLEGLRLWSTTKGIGAEVPFHPTRLVLNDSGGLPAMADLAALRDAVRRAGGDPARINPGVPADMVIDHSVMVDAFGTRDAVTRNLDLEYERNGERYAFLRWCEQAFRGFRVASPGQGILHQVNLEHMARCVWTTQHGAMCWAFPESLMGTDSHTPMVNALGVLGWGVGGIEATAGVLGQPIGIVLPRVVGCRLVGTPAQGVTATDITLLVVQRLRAYGVIAAYVEFFGPALSRLSLPDRATLSNMAPEYGATMGFCPVDAETIRFLELTGRGGAHGRLVEAYCRAQGLWHEADGPQPDFLETIEIDLSDAEPAAAGPRRPQDRVALPQIRTSFDAAFPPREAIPQGSLPDGAVVIAAITSCTNTSNPDGMLGAGILARKAAARGLTTKPWVKTSLAPGSTVVAEYLQATGLQDDLDQLGFNLIGFGCTTCMGNSGPLPEAVEQAIGIGGSVAVAVLSGNRNFEGRVHTLAKANYIMSPALVVAHALAGTIRIDLTHEPIGLGRDGHPVMLSDIWPTPAEIAEAREIALTTERFERRYGAVFAGDDRWRSLGGPGGDTFPWSKNSLYMQEPPFLQDVPTEPQPATDLRGARMLVLLGDSVTTDHISPVGVITPDSASGRYLIEHQVRPRDFNSFAARRLNHHVMIRGTFGNIRLRNRLAAGTEGGWTRHQPSGDVMPIHEAAERYRAEGVPVIVVAGSEYGTGSSRDWAAKGTRLLGVPVVIAGNFERIHRSNLVYLGVLPLQFPEGVTPETLRLDGTETFDVNGIAPAPAPASTVTLSIHRDDGRTETVPLLCRLDTPFEAECFRHGGILPRVLRQHLAGLRQGGHAA